MQLLITTGCGYPIQGGSDVWVNHFLKEVYPIISKTDDYVVLVDGKKPIDWSNEGFEDIPIYFYFEDTERSVELLKTCTKIHFLHSHYHIREHIYPFRTKFETIYVHSYPYDMLQGDKVDFSKMQFGTRVSSNEFTELVNYCKNKVWIGISKNSHLFKDFDDIIHIPNFYEFKDNLELPNELNTTIGFTARCENRKNARYLTNKHGYVLTNKYDWINLRETVNVNFSNLKFYQWDSKILDSFMRKDWGISHSCHRNEPFGYSIFQAVDYGKLPIIHRDWATELDYRYRANSQDQFDIAWLNIVMDSDEVRQREFKKLKEFMLNFNSMEKWSVKNVKVCTFG
jgi:hypothetical protein